MNLWIIHAQENPAEPRHLENRREWRSNSIAEELADRGHDVTRWRSSFSHQAKTQLVANSEAVPAENYTLQYIYAPAYKRHVGIRRILSHRALGKEFKRIASLRSDKPDLIHVGNVPTELCAAAVQFGKEYRIPVIVDIRDLWPDSYADLLPFELGRLRSPVVRLLQGLSRQTRRALRDAAAISALTDSFLDWALRLAQRQKRPEDVVVPMCYPAPRVSNDPDQSALLREKLCVSQESKLAIYLGNIGFQSNFDALVEAAEFLSEQRSDVVIVLAGSGPRYDQMRESSGRIPNLVVPGWLNADDVSVILSQATFGLIAYRNIPNYEMNLPNKFSEYLAAGLPVAAGIGGEMGNLVEQHNCGFVYAEHDGKELARKLMHYESSRSDVANMSRNAKILHASRFDRNVVIPELADFLERVAMKHE
ncbi:MAG: glycosyltransferase family 4 protein [Pseudomonadota bacterium]